MKFLKFAPLAVSIFLSGGMISNAASVLFEQNGTIVNGWYSDASLPNPQALGDSFQTVSAWSVAVVTWYGVYSNNSLPADSFTVKIWDTGTSGLPTVVLPLDEGPVTRQATGQNTTWGWAIYEYTMLLNSPLMLASDTTYVLEVQNDTSGSTQNWAWLTASGPRFLYHREGTWYQGDFGNPLFAIQGQAVPEPATYAAMLGAMALGFVAYRRRQQTA